jgi:hypothetical protein
MKSFATKIINFNGYTDREMIVEVAAVDGCTFEEAEKRIAKAKIQSTNRAKGQFMRHLKQKYR